MYVGGNESNARSDKKVTATASPALMPLYVLTSEGLYLLCHLPNLRRAVVAWHRVANCLLHVIREQRTLHVPLPFVGITQRRTCTERSAQYLPYFTLFIAHPFGDEGVLARAIAAMHVAFCRTSL